MKEDNYYLMKSLRDFIRRTAEIEQYQCSVCFQLDHKVVRLTCPCQKYLCLSCMNKKITCDFCTVAVEVEIVEKLNFEFNCLSNSPLCKLTFHSTKELLRHCTSSCPYIKEILKRELLQAMNYECVKGHRLQIGNTWRECILCNKGRCKSRCMTCHKQKRKQAQISENIYDPSGYCIHCRPIPCTTSKCPHDHDLKRVTSRSATCDICDNSVRKFPLPVYSDRACDFDICSNCYKDLEEEHMFLPIPIRLPTREAIDSQES